MAAKANPAHQKVQMILLLHSPSSCKNRGLLAVLTRAIFHQSCTVSHPLLYPTQPQATIQSHVHLYQNLHTHLCVQYIFEHRLYKAVASSSGGGLDLQRNRTVVKCKRGPKDRHLERCVTEGKTNLRCQLASLNTEHNTCLFKPVPPPCLQLVSYKLTATPDNTMLRVHTLHNPICVGHPPAAQRCCSCCCAGPAWRVPLCVRCAD